VAYFKTFPPPNSSQRTFSVLKGITVTDEKLPPDQEKIPVEPEPEEEVIDVTFFDRVLAFLALVFPWALLVDKMQELLLNIVGDYVNKMIVLVALIAFLLIVNRFAKLIYSIRTKKR
jgi:hypothetical protein